MIPGLHKRLQIRALEKPLMFLDAMGPNEGSVAMDSEDCFRKGWGHRATTPNPLTPQSPTLDFNGGSFVKKWLFRLLFLPEGWQVYLQVYNGG